MAQRDSVSPRRAFREAKGFSRLERLMGEELILERSAEGVLQAAKRWLPQLSAVNVVTALNRIAKSTDGRACMGTRSVACNEEPMYDIGRLCIQLETP